MTIQSHHLHTHGPDPMRPAGKPHKAQWMPEVHRFDLDDEKTWPDPERDGEYVLVYFGTDSLLEHGEYPYEIKRTEDHTSMVQMIQLTRGQEETLARITTALEQIADNTSEITEPTVHKEERRWRKCSQELPEDNVIVLGIVMRSDKSYYYILNYRRRGSWVKSDYPQYWMPLPQFDGGREL